MTTQALLQWSALGLERAATCLAVLAAVVPMLAACRPQRPTVRDVGTAPLNTQAARCANLALDRRGLELVVLGSGGPRSAGRAASSYLFTIDGTPRIVVDVGPGSFARLGEAGLSAERLDTILLTHLHIDHAGDFAALVKSRDLSSDDAVAFRIVGPTGRAPYPSTSEFVERLFGENGAYAYLPSFRNELRLERSDIAADLDAPPRRVFDVDGAAISAVTVDHGEVPALAYRLDRAGRSFVISGDLASRRGHLPELTRGADVLVYDTAVLDPPDSPDKRYELHTPPTRIGEIAARAGVKVLILGHIPPAVDANRDEVLRSVRRSFKGDVRFAEDCMHVSIGGDS
jgi:ribonuclease BN (tRNA processing enzyme)